MPAISKSFSYTVPEYRRKKGCSGQVPVKVQDTKYDVITTLDFQCNINIFQRSLLSLQIAYKTDVEPYLGVNRRILGYKQTQRQQQISVSYYEICKNNVKIPSQSEALSMLNIYNSDIPDPDIRRNYPIASQNTYNYSFDKSNGLFVVNETKIYVEFIMDIFCNIPNRVITSFQGALSFSSEEINQRREEITIIENPII